MVEEFLEQYIPSTRKKYGEVLAQLESLTGTPPVEATQKTLLAYRRAIAHNAPGTVRRKLGTLGAFYTYLQRRGVRDDNPMLIIRRPKVDPRRTIKWLNVDEVKALLNVASTDTRDHAMIWLALHGLRVSEIVALNAEQYSDGTLWGLQGKGGTTRTVELADQAQRALDAYLAGRRTGPLLVGSRGRLHARRMQTLVYTLTERAGRKINIHALRHTFCTHAIRNGVNPLVLAEIVGHASTATTQRYVHLDGATRRDAVEKTFADVASLEVIPGGLVEQAI